MEWSPWAFLRTMGTGVGEADQRSGKASDRLFEDPENGLLGGRGKEDQGEDRQVLFALYHEE